LKWASYSRVSTDGQSGLDRYGLERQDRENERYIRATGHTGEIALFRDTISGKKESRDEFERLIALAREGTVTAVVFPEVDRLGREVFTSTILILEAWTAGLEVHNAKVGFVDRTNPESRRRFMQDAIEADREHEKIVRRLQMGKEDAIRDGHGITVIGFGYKHIYKTALEPPRNEIDPDQAAIIVQAAEWAATGSSLRTISKGLHRMFGLKFADRTIYNWFRRGVYRGEFRYRESSIRNNRSKSKDLIVIPVPHLRILEPDLAARVDAGLSYRTKNRANLSAKIHESPLIGIARCRECGAAMSRRPGNPLKYCCLRRWSLNYRNPDGTPGCANPYHIAPLLEKAVWGVLHAEFFAPDALKRLERDWMARHGTPREDTKRRALEVALTTAERAVTRWSQAFEDAPTPEEASHARRKLGEALERVATNGTALRQFQERVPMKPDFASFIARMHQIIPNPNQMPDALEYHRVLKTLGLHVLVGAKGEIEFTLGTL
jgi:DNA invertase Pin-like site-specific DNA recombinase